METLVAIIISIIMVKWLKGMSRPPQGRPLDIDKMWDDIYAGKSQKELNRNIDRGVYDKKDK